MEHELKLTGEQKQFIKEHKNFSAAKLSKRLGIPIEELNHYIDSKRRLNFAGKVLAGVLSLGIIAGVSYKFFKNDLTKNVQQKYFEMDKNEIDLKKEYIVEEPIPVLLSDQEIMAIRNYFLQKDIPLLKIERTENKEWIIPLDENSQKEINLEQIAKSIDDLFRFVGSEKIKKPQIIPIIPKNAEQINLLAKNDETSMYFVKIKGTDKKTDVLIDIGGEVFRVKYSQSEYTLGETKIRINFVVNELKEIIRAENKSGNIIISRSEKELLNKISPSFEALHKAMNPYTTKNIERIVMRLYGKSFDNEGTGSVVKILSEYEEGIVHAITFKWLRSNFENLDATKEQIEEALEKQKKLPPYKHIQKYLDKMEEVGIKKTIEDYINGELPK